MWSANVERTEELESTAESVRSESRQGEESKDEEKDLRGNLLSLYLHPLSLSSSA